MRSIRLALVLCLFAPAFVFAEPPDPISPAELAARFQAASPAAADLAALAGDWTWIVASFGPRTIVASRAIAMPDGSLTALRIENGQIAAESYKPFWLRRLECSSRRSPFSAERRSPLSAGGAFALPKVAGRGCWSDPSLFHCGSRVACDDGLAGLAGRCRAIAPDRLVCRVTLDYDRLGAPLSGYMGFVRGLVEPRTASGR